MAGWIRNAWAAARAPLNKVAFEVRRRRAISRGLPQLQREPMRRLFDSLDGGERRRAVLREAELRAKYGLDSLRASSSRRDYREALDLLELLDPVELPPPRDGRLRVVDVGARNWTYAGALERWVAARARSIELTGVEVDGHPVYRDGFARCDYARAYARATGNPGVRYEVADFRTWPAHDLDAVTLLHPFVTRYALLDWGLPAELFDPAAIVARAVAVLRADRGLLVAVHQTLAERDAMLEWLEPHRDAIEVEDARPAPAWLTADRHLRAGRQIIVARRTGE